MDFFSFGDNELSPECLDGAQKFLKPDGISIPYEYTSFLGPLQVPLHFPTPNLYLISAFRLRAQSCTMRCASARTRQSTQWPTLKPPTLSTFKIGLNWRHHSPSSPSTTPIGTRLSTTQGGIKNILFLKRYSGNIFNIFQVC